MYLSLSKLWTYTISRDTIQWIVHLLPWQPVSGECDPGSRNLVLAVFPRRPAPAKQIEGIQQRRFGLTTAEHDVLSALLQGKSAKAIAIERQAALNTIRSQINAVLRKTGFHSQRELMAGFGSSALFEDSQC